MTTSPCGLSAISATGASACSGSGAVLSAVAGAMVAVFAMGFTGSGNDTLTSALGVACDKRGNTITANYRTSVTGVYAAGDRRRGASLIVWAIREGRDAAAAIHEEQLS